jgi:superfamily II DNA/RNA helicase
VLSGALLIPLQGRTGRAGKMGIAITFLTNDDDEVMWVCYLLFRIHSSINCSGTTSSKVRDIWVRDNCQS